MAGVALSRDSFLSFVGQLAEETVDVPGMGLVLCRELTGAQRAQVLQVLAPAVQEGGRADLGAYQEMLLELGLIDPADGKPLLDLATRKEAMKLGASKVELLCSTIERLSGLSGKAPESAEKNLPSTANSTSTSE
jgi:hypothetical protein